MCEHFHYQLARELNQLAPAHVQLVDDAVQVYQTIREQAGTVAGNIKIEPLTLCTPDNQFGNILTAPERHEVQV